MKRRDLTHLNHLLQEFHISGKQLADLVNVDCSLVSKWRSGSRHMNREYAHKISGIILSLDAGNGFQRVQEVLGKKYPPCDSRVSAKIGADLELWLMTADPEAEKPGVEPYLVGQPRKSEYYLFMGESGKRDAVRTFLDIAMSESNQVLWLFTQEDCNWLSSDHAYILDWQQRNFHVLQQGNVIHVIHPVGKKYRQMVEMMIRWIPLHLYGNAMAYYVPRYLDEQVKMSIFLIEGKVALLNITADNYTHQLRSYMFSDSNMLENLKAVLMSWFQQSTRMFKRYPYQNRGQFFGAFEQLFQPKIPIYYFCGEPVSFLLDYATLQALLEENEDREDEKNAFRKVLYPCSMDHILENGSPQIVYMLHQDQLEDTLQESRVILRSISYCVGRPFYVSQTRFRQLMCQALDHACENPAVSLILSDHSILYPDKGIDIFIKGKIVAGFVGPYDQNGKEACAMTTQEESVVTALYHYCQNFVELHPHGGLSKETTRERIFQLFEKYPLDGFEEETM